MEVALVCHPATPDPAVRAIVVRVRRAPADGLALTFRLDGDLARVRVPSPRPTTITRDLWRHTCCEAFVAVDGVPAYHEFNVSPSGEWMAHAFSGYRLGGPLDDETLAPRIVVQRAGDRLCVEVRIPLARLSQRHVNAPLRLGLAVVVEATDGTLSSWALRHPGATPDFHHPGAFALRLEPPPVE